ncbi:unnamed protein product [Lepeophtheirus salmonis]|uniref:(salmon louse) hypothetical protein n=1 Tax=Lepeophtheirus salmonis TaxID=72036 RepID=A0A7R8H0Z7_LEPSM|nr:unnamed protein product [Lepeophtheirus salmonis]CAF2801374.1 unnamed protein product [Lepeophtheirus salmonis]
MRLERWASLPSTSFHSLKIIASGKSGSSFCGSPKLAKYPRICDRHFSEDCVLRAECRKTELRKGAIPTLNGAKTVTLSQLKHSKLEYLKMTQSKVEKEFLDKVENVMEKPNRRLLLPLEPILDFEGIAEYIKNDCNVLPPWYVYHAGDLVHIFKVDFVGNLPPITTMDFIFNKTNGKCVFNQKFRDVPLSYLSSKHFDSKGVLKLRDRNSIDRIIKILREMGEEIFAAPDFKDLVNMSRVVAVEASLLDVRRNKALEFVTGQLSIMSGAVRTYSPSLTSFCAHVKEQSNSIYNALRNSGFFILPSDPITKAAAKRKRKEAKELLENPVHEEVRDEGDEEEEELEEDPGEIATLDHHVEQEVCVETSGKHSS